MHVSMARCASSWVVILDHLDDAVVFAMKILKSLQDMLITSPPFLEGLSKCECFDTTHIDILTL